MNTTTTDRAQLRNVLLFAISVGLMVVVASRHDLGGWWLSRATYFTVLGVVGAWVVRFIAWGRARWASPLALLRDSWPELALAALAMGLLFLTHDWQFKVLSDETNLVSIGRSMAFEWRFDFPNDGKFYFGTQHGFSYVFDKRPPLFGFVLSLVNSLTGYRVRNIWLLNGAILGATLVVVGGFLRRRLGRPWNLLAVVWVIANPVVMMTSSGAGVEPLLCLLWAIAGVLLLDVLEDPNERNFGLFVATLFLLGLCRLEAGPLAALMLVGILAASPQRARVAGMLRDDPLVWLAPLVALPIILLKARTKDYFQGLTSKPFSIDHVLDNVSNWIAILKDGGRFYPYSAVVTVVEAVSVVVLLVLVVSNRVKTSRAEKTALLLFSGLTSAFVALYSAYFWGQPTNPACARFYALPMFFAALAVPALLARIEALRARPAPAVVAFVLVFFHAFPASHGRAFANAFTWRKQHHILADYLLPQIPAKQLLIVTAIPSQLVIYDVGAISYSLFKNSREGYLRELDRKLYDEILFVQEIRLADGQPTPETTAPPEVTLETLMERQHSGGTYLRISRLKREATPRPASQEAPKTSAVTVTPAPAENPKPLAPAVTETPVPTDPAQPPAVNATPDAPQPPGQ